MIAWMQKNNKYLVWTIWIATIAFIGAGFVGWGTYQFGSKASSVAKVGEVEIERYKLNTVYSNLYSRYAEMFGGKFDDAQAKQIGLLSQAFNQLEVQALVLNLALELGLEVTDQEVAQALITIKAFQTDGKFDRTIYDNYLRAKRIRSVEFEAMLKDELLVEKVMGLLSIEPLPLEIEAVAYATRLQDKLRYKVFGLNDVNITLQEDALKGFWEAQKERYLTPKRYKVSILWIDTSDANVTDDEIKRFYDENSFRYTDANGKILEFEDVKDLVENDLKVKKSKKKAQKGYIAFKKGKAQPSETIILDEGDAKLTPEIWRVLRESKPDTYIKPKVVGTYYAIIKLEALQEPRIMEYAEAKERVKEEYEKQQKHIALEKLAQDAQQKLEAFSPQMSPYVSVDSDVTLDPLSRQETRQFLQNLFTSKEEKGMISLSDKIVVYEIFDQKVVNLDVNQSDTSESLTNKLKSSLFERHLIEYLRTRFSTQKFVEGL